MYEIWLMMNIVWEIALGFWPLLVVGVLAWLALLVAAVRHRRPQWRHGLPLALAAGAAVAVLAFLAVPSLTRSSLGELRYWVDWANLLGIAAGAGAATIAVVWPMLAMRQPPRAA